MNNLEKDGKKITLTLLASQSLFSASIIITFTVGAIIVVELANNNSQWTGVPATLIVVAAALIAYPMGRLIGKMGYRIGLSIGYLFGIAGTLISGWAIINQSLYIFLLGIFCLGLTKGTIDMARYAAAEASLPDMRARRLSWIILAGTVGSILGPGLIEATGNLADRVGLPALSGPWFAAAFFFLLSLIITYSFLQPDPQAIGRQLAALEPAPSLQEIAGGRPYREIIQDSHAKLATGALIFGQLAMVVVMTVTPIHMHGHNHTIGSISWVIMAHTMGMFGLSFVTGWLTDKLGRPKVILSGGIILAISCLTAPISNSVLWLAIALFLLGLGWNFCFVAGSTLLSEILKPQERGRVQGLTDTMINAVSGIGSISSGLIFAALGFTAMSWITILIGLLPVILVIVLRVSRPEVSMGGMASS